MQANSLRYLMQANSLRYLMQVTARVISAG